MASGICSSFLSQFSQPQPTISPSLSTSNHRIKLLKVSCKAASPKPLKPLPFACNLTPFGKRYRNYARSSGEGESVVESDEFYLQSRKTLIQGIVRPIIYTVFCLWIGLCSVGAHGLSAVAAPVVSELNLGSKEERELSSKRHEYADYTRRLLEQVSRLLACIEEVRRGDANLKKVKLALKAVKSKKEELEREIMEGLFQQVMELKREKWGLEKNAAKIVDRAVKAKSDYDEAAEKGDKERAEKLQESIKKQEKEYSGVWEKIGEIEDTILRKETMAIGIGVRELSFIERESVELVKGFSKEMLRKSESPAQRSVTNICKSEIKKQLDAAHMKQLEQIILPNVVDGGHLTPSLDQESMDFAQRINQGLEESKEMQKGLETQIRKSMRKFGDEKRLVLKTPDNEVVKGFPDVELKWMFGDEEVVVPKAIGLHLYHGWKQWREEAKADLKRNLLEDVDFGKQYVSQQQESVLVNRDRIVSKTWYNEERRRWEMDPVAVPYAVSKKLLQHARIRHDWGAMYIKLKGEDKECYIDIKEFDMLYEDFGGFDALYMKMIACGIPTAVQFMWIPLSELDIWQQFLLSTRLAQQLFNAIVKDKNVSFCSNWVFEKIRDINDDIMMVVLFPIAEFVIPYPVRVKLGMAWPEETGQMVATTWYLQWQSVAEIRFKSRYTEGFWWFFRFVIRLGIYGFLMMHLFRFIKRRKLPRLLGFGPLRSRDPSLQKLRRVRTYMRYKLSSIKSKKKEGIDPIKTAFEKMKRVKDPPISLKGFSSIDSMREEINEVVTFLRNPSAFQEMGARAPRWSRETKYPHAVWAAGRGLIALLLPNFDVVDNLWLEPGSWQGIGCTKISKSRHEGTMYGNSESRSYLEKKLVFCFGSYVASQLLLPFGQENFLASSELKQAQEIATRMVIQYGWGPDDSPAIYFSRNASTCLSMGNKHEYEMAAKVEKIYDLAYTRAKACFRKIV